MSSSSYSESESYSITASSEAPKSKVLPKPKTRQESGAGVLERNGRVPGLTYGFSSMQGYRPEMEDAHCALPVTGAHNYSFFGVFDGHGGHEVANLCATEIPKRVNSVLDKISSPSVPADVVDAIKFAYVSLDEKLIAKAKKKNTGYYPGSTAVLAVITPTHLVVGNAGDSRILISQNGLCVPMTTDHSVHLPNEKARIENTDFHIESSDSMVAGRMPHTRSDGSEAREALNMSRSIGDAGFKMDKRLHRTAQAVVADPEISHIERDGSFQFMVLACDGIFEQMSNEHVIDFVGAQLARGYSPEQAAQKLLSESLARGSMDNMTAVIVEFESFEQRRRPICGCC